MAEKKAPSFTITADDEAFEKVVWTYAEAHWTRFEQSTEERQKESDRLAALIRDARDWQRDKGIGKAKLDLKRKWQKIE